MKSLRVCVQLVLFGGLPLLHAQTSIDLRTQTKSVDFSSAVSTKPSKVGTVLPAACSVGETFFHSSALAGRNLYGCIATNSWTLLGANLWFGGGAVSAGDCAKFDSSGNLVSAGGECGGVTSVTLASPFASSGSLLISAGAGRQGAASLCTENGGTLTCPGGFSGRTSWLGGSGIYSRQILGPAGSFSANFNYRWSDAVPAGATLMRIGAPASGESSLGPAVPDTDYVTPSGTGTVQNKSFDGSNLFSSYLPWAQTSKPATPATGYLRVFAKSGGGLCWVNSAGTESCAGAGSLGDPGGTGILVETSAGVMVNRTITAGSSNVSITDGTGATGNPTIDIGSTVDFSGKTTSPVQVGTVGSMPVTCSTGQLYFASDAVTGRKLQTCTAANTWTPAGYDQGAVTPGTCSLGQLFFNTAAASGRNFYFCTATNTWTQMHGDIPSVFGRTGAVTAEAGDYSYPQISGTPSALPPNGAAFGDLSGSYPNPTVSQVNGAAIPSSGLLKANGSRQVIQATAGADYAPATGTSSILKGNGTGGFATAVAGDVVGLFANCGGSQYLGADGACHTASGGGVVLVAGAGAPSANCAAPSSSNLAIYLDTTNNDKWWCYATNSWRKDLSVTGSGPYLLTGATGSAPAAPSSGLVNCYFDSTFAQVCVDASGSAWQMVKQTTLAGLQRRSCDFPVGDTAGVVLTSGQLGPQSRICYIPAAATIVEIDVNADAGAPNVVVGSNHAGTVTNIVSSALATAASGGIACSNTGGTTGLDGATSCSSTLQNISLAAGDYLELVSGTAGGTAKFFVVHVVYSVN